MGGGEGLGIGAIYAFDIWRGIIFVDLFFFWGGEGGLLVGIERYSYICFLCHTKSRCSSRLVEGSTPDVVDGKSVQTTPRSAPLPPSNSASGSRRGSALLPSQQSCEVDDDELANENSLMTELMQVQQLSVSQDSFVIIKNYFND